MAGSGKTTFMQRLASHLSTIKKPGYLLNLDPAVAKVPYNANVDIRDTVSKAALARREVFACEYGHPRMTNCV